MITLRGDLRLWLGVKDCHGLRGPGTTAGGAGRRKAVAWMSPDELLILCDYADAPGLTASLTKALDGQFATVANVSDARAVFTLTGAQAGDALAKLCPVDFGAMTDGDIRRTRAAQVAAAIWVSGPQEMTWSVSARSGNTCSTCFLARQQPGSEPKLSA